MPESNSLFANVWRCFLSPKLFRIYNLRNSNGYYEPNALEKWGDTIIQASIVLWHVTCYAFPVMVYTAYKRNYFTTEGQIFLLKLGAVGAITICSAFVLRALGRATNATYLEFNEKYRSIIRNYNSETKKQLQNYEFDYTAWPVDFDLKSDKYKGKVSIACSEGTFSKALSSPSSLVGYAALHSFAIKMIYPGSISTINYLIRNNLSIGRKKLIEEKHAERFKLATPDNNELDVMFVDQRNKTALGSTLVICTEGNAGFYEIGIMVTPLDLGYSVLGWNHPGFGWSTGTPYIYAEKCAMETVLQFAFQRLNYIPENIILFGWSIGGFASSYAATVYPDIRAVILDATFDDILPLAVKQMPKFLEPIVNVSIRDHANLDVASQLTQYCGPIVLIRRSEDEIISLTEGDISTNRGNYLLLRILKSRYPQLFTNETEAALWAWFGVTAHKKDLIYEKFKVNLDACKSEYDAYKSKLGRQYPTSFGKDFDIQKKTQMLLYLASLYMVDFPSSHCTSLPSDMFHSFSQI
ncbi:phosphatidylserine lipase ABHD16A isoform X1 [Planococcus citri]|uniref:phosphatidylserine lipase ABHD16A isoform X1 n=2 Tax=Planococcus citri TaxID=170843 RepID=UPI0031F893D4